MAWELKWEGRATDFIPELLATSGKPGSVALLAKEALWEAVQRAGERNPSAWAVAKATGTEHPEEPGSGQFNLSVLVSEDAPEVDGIHEQLRRQQPVDLLRTRGGYTSPPSPESAGIPTPSQATG